MSERNFFAELKRRNVYKVAVAYAVIGWLLVQAASILFPTFEAPPWVMKVFVAVVALGFPVALVIAWAFEMTPEGMKRTEDLSPNEPIPQWSRRKFATLIVTVALIAAGLLTYQLFRAKGPAVEPAPVGPPATEKSIAVLPFENLSRDPDNAFFADGIQDEILARLSKITDLKVISRTSTQKYRSTPSNLREIAQQLGVANILEGSVQHAADKVRVTVQLINAGTDAHLWAETYDRKLLDTFEVESDIAQKIASTLEAKLTGKERAAIAARGTDNPQAYEAYLRALALNNSQAGADSARERDLFREAVRLDPNFAEAWAWLAATEASRYFFPEENQAQKERAHTAAETAVRLAPESPDAQGSMGLYYYYVEKNYDEALRWLERARSAVPNDWKVINAIGLVKRRQGKLDETIELQKRGAELNPLDVNVWVELAWSYRGRRDLVQARTTLDRALALSPHDANVIAVKAETYLAAGDLEKSWEMLRDLTFGPTDDGLGPVINVLLARRDWDELIRRLEAIRNDEPPLFRTIDGVAVAIVERFRGNKAAAEPLLRDAERELRELRNRHEGGVIVLESLVRVEACFGRRDQVNSIGEELRAILRFDKWAYPRADLNIALAYAIMGDADDAIPLLERVLHENYASAITPAYLRVDPTYDRIRNDPRFQNLCEEKPK
ncbi:MAG: tetratricopeptide repeat protein [Chthoniobacterales bacterium]